MKGSKNMAIDITMDDGEDRRPLRDQLSVIKDEYDEKLEFEPGFWSKAWKETKKKGSAFLTWLGKELKQFWERGGREIVTFGGLYALTLLCAPAAVPAVLAVAPILIPVIFYRAFQMA